MADIDNGASVEVQGSGTTTYVLKNVGGVYSCSCPAWRYQGVPAETRTCKHLRVFRGDAAEDARVSAAGAAVASAQVPAAPQPQAPAPTAVVKAPPLLLAHRWDAGAVIKGWWMSEKLDGMRAYWDGTGLFSRNGNPILAPDWFCAGLPDYALDGELWIGRKRFQETVSIVRRQDQSGDWKSVTYQVFDAPGIPGPFEDRLTGVRQSFAQAKPPYAVVLPQAVCSGIAELKEELVRVTAVGGEGIMLRKPASQYVAGRSSTLLKVKSFFDAEAKVVGHEPGKGKHKGRLGALDCELPDGTRFRVGTGFSDAERESPPAMGAIVTFRFQELTKDGVPRFPSFVGERHDVSWPTAWPPTTVNNPGGVTSIVTAQPAPPPQDPASPPPSHAASAADAASAVPSPPPTDAVSVAASAPPPVASTPSASPQVAETPTPDVQIAGEPLGTPGHRRHFEAMEKFWEVEVRGSEVWTRFGRVGSHGQPRCKSFASETAAMQWAEEQAAKKVAIGFVET